jgi:hypothetical protein
VFPGAQVLELVVSWVVTTVFTFLVVLVDERRLRPHRLERAWPTASRNWHIVYFGVLSLPFHFAKTRGSWTSVRDALRRIMGFFLGLVVAVVVALASGFVVMGVDWVLGIPIE